MGKLIIRTKGGFKEADVVKDYELFKEKEDSELIPFTNLQLVDILFLKLSSCQQTSVCDGREDLVKKALSIAEEDGFDYVSIENPEIDISHDHLSEDSFTRKFSQVTDTYSLYPIKCYMKV